MRLVIKELNIDDNNPFQNDLFERKEFSQKLTNLIKNIDDKLVISLNSDWGQGKTTFVKMWQASLRQEKIKSIYFDSFQNDYSNDPFLDIASAIYSFVDEEFSDSEEIKLAQSQFKNKLVNFSKGILSLGAKVSIRAATLGALNGSDIDEIKDIAKDISKDTSDFIEKSLLHNLVNHVEHKETINEFKEKITELAEKIKNTQDFPLLFIVDELDRCRPNYAIELLEKVKHLFSVENIVFILVTNKKQLEQSIKSVYGNIDSELYLQKFIHLESDLPRKYGYKSKNDINSYTEFLHTAHEFPEWVEKEAFVNNFSCLAEYYDLTLRDIERSFTHLALFYSSITKSTFALNPVICLLVITKVKFNEKYIKLKHSKYTYTEFEKSFNLGGIDKNYYPRVYPDYFSTCFMYCLFSEDEYKNSPADHDVKQIGNYSHRDNRLRLISAYCNNIDAFVAYAI